MSTTARHHVQATVPRMPVPPLPAHPTGILAELIATWSRLVEPIAPGGADGDFEDWVESAFRLHATLEAFGPEHVRLRFTSRRPNQQDLEAGDALVALTNAPDAAQARDALRHLVSSGRSRRREMFLDAHTGAELTGPQPALLDVGIVMGTHGAEYTRSGEIASDYMTLSTFAQHAGRKLELAGISTEDDHDAERAIDRMRAAGVGRIYAKMRESKMLNVIIEPGATLMDSVDENEGWALVRAAGTRESLLIQEWIPMRYEYRLFIAGTRPVTGAGSLVERTPLDNTGVPFDPYVREHRNDDGPNHGGAPVARPDLVTQYVQFAHDVAAQLATEAPDLTDYVMDVALAADGQPLVIELNACENSGLFASQPHVFMAARARALAAAPHTHRPQTLPDLTELTHP